MTFYKSGLFKQLIGGSPIVLVDVGARGGIAPKWQPLNESLQIIGFEPDAEECKKLNAAGGKCVYYPIALAGKKGVIKLNVTRNQDCASIIEPNKELLDRFQSPEDFEVVDTPEIPCDTLDNVVATNNVQSIDFIKVDTQGSELEILRGAEKTLSQCYVFGVEVEAEFSPMYKDQSFFADIDVFLREKGFTLFDIRTPPGRRVRKTVPAGSREWMGQALWTDAVYFRDLATNESGRREKLTRETAVKTIATAELHGFGDFALELLDTYRNESIVSDAEYRAIKKMLLSPREGFFRPEIRLLQNIKRTAGEFLHDRFPAVHKWIVKSILK
jgi:FkbM family methyltransferase